MKKNNFKLLFFFSVLCLFSTAFAQTTNSTSLPSQSLDLSMRGMFGLVHSSPKQFESKWNKRRLAAEKSLSSSKNKLDLLNIQWQWAAGLVNYPFFHHRETGKRLPRDWAPKLMAVAQINFNDPSALQSEHYLDFLNAWLHDQSETAIQTEPIYKSGDNRWLRAKFSAIEKHIHHPEIARFLMQRELTIHVDENGAKNIAEQISSLEKMGSDPALIQKFSASLTQENSPPTDHVAQVYKHVDGVDLVAHIFKPKNHISAAPTLIWFHGGSWEKGHWSHCPIVCRTLQSLGFVIVQVEYRTSQRFDGTPLDALKDANDVLAWLSNNADSLNIDTDKIITGGFSSGGVLASQLAVLTENKIHGGAFVSACFNPSADSWYNSVVSPITNTKKLDPLLMLNKHSPALIIFHTKDDEMCPYTGAVEMQFRSQQLQIDTQLISFEKGGHFFPFTTPALREQVQSGLKDYVLRLKWFK